MPRILVFFYFFLQLPADVLLGVSNNNKLAAVERDYDSDKRITILHCSVDTIIIIYYNMQYNIVGT